MIIRLAALLALLTLLSACGNSATPVITARHPSISARPAPTTTTTSTPSPEQVHADELGAVPVLMYHRIVATPQSVYDRTPADFRAELERLAAAGYVPITATRFVSGDIDIPAGTHPVVLTFDDGDPSQFALTPAGTPVGTTAVGILLSVAREHPAFTPVATFYVNTNPFGDPGGRHTLPWLHAHGFDIGNHTLTHADLRTATTATVQSEILQCDQEIRAAAPDAAPTTIALPYGLHPKPATLALHGTGYDYQAAFLVGANPSPSPFSAAFDPLNVPRIRSEAATGPDAQYGSTAWLDKLAAGTDIPYTSDGDPNRISFPRTEHQTIAPGHQSQANPY